MGGKTAVNFIDVDGNLKGFACENFIIWNENP
jgi:hypothetical protein